MSEKIVVSVYRRDNQYWIIFKEKYQGIALDRRSFERRPAWWPNFDHNFARLNAMPCGKIESLYVLRKFYRNYDIPYSLVLE